jgi:hypothetical protein
MDHAHARARQHRHRQLGHHRKVEGDPIASLHPTEVQQQCGELVDPAMELLMARGAVWRRQRRDGAGSRGRFRAAGGAVKATTGARALKTFPGEVRDGAIWLVG